MLNASTAVEVLKALRPHTLVTLTDGTRALVMCQCSGWVTVLVGRVVMVVERWEVTP